MDFLSNEDLENLPLGRTYIDGEEVYSNVQEYMTMPESECKYEVHDRTIRETLVASHSQRLCC